MTGVLGRVGTAAAASALIVVGLAGPASAHPHRVSVAHQGAGQALANEQLHAAYSSSGLVCAGDSAAYGLETAHQGPDSVTPGKGDGCYQLDSMPPGSDVSSPVIR